MLSLGSSAAPATAAPGPATIGTDGFARFDVTADAGATAVWIEVEGAGLTAADVVVRLGNVNQTVTTTALGAIAIVPASGSTLSFAVALTTGATPDIAITVIDAVGTVLSSTSYNLTLVDYRTLPQTSAAAVGVPSALAATGLNLGIYLAITLLGGLAVAVGIALRTRTRKLVTA